MCRVVVDAMRAREIRAAPRAKVEALRFRFIRHLAREGSDPAGGEVVSIDTARGRFLFFAHLISK